MDELNISVGANCCKTTLMSLNNCVMFGTCFTYCFGLRVILVNWWLFPLVVSKGLARIPDKTINIMEAIHASLHSLPTLNKLDMLPGTHYFKSSVTRTYTLQPLCDLSVTNNFYRSQRSQQCPRLVLSRLQRSRGPPCFLSMFKNLVETDFFVRNMMCMFQDVLFSVII